MSEGRGFPPDLSYIAKTLGYLCDALANKCEKIMVEGDVKSSQIHLCENGYLILITDLKMNLPLLSFLLPRVLYKIDNAVGEDVEDIRELIKERIKREVTLENARFKEVQMIIQDGILHARVEIYLLDDEVFCDTFSVRKAISTILDEECPLHLPFEKDILFVQRSSQLVRVTRHQLLQIINKVRGI